MGEFNSCVHASLVSFLVHGGTWQYSIYMRSARKKIEMGIKNDMIITDARAGYCSNRNDEQNTPVH
jgi:hypothetical protein